MTERITGKVAKITSDREVILNRGSEHGVEQGMYFYIKGDPIDIADPDTNESLGSVTPIKIVVQVGEVSEKFCIARTFRSQRVKVADAVKGGDLYSSFAMGGGLGRQFQPPQPAKYETRVETLRIDPKRGEPLALGDSVVSVGDAVESVLEGEDIDPVTTTMFR
jgi:hypothetical protein